MKTTDNVIITFQDPETKLYDVQGKHLTQEELDKLIAIMPGHRWIIINWCDPPSILHTPDSFDGGRLPDSTLRKLVDGEPLTETDKDDIINSAIN